MNTTLCPTPFVDCDHPKVIAFARDNAGDSNDVYHMAVSLYYAVRDQIRYDPYSIRISAEGLCASTVLEQGRGWCVNKAVLLAAG